MINNFVNDHIVIFIILIFIIIVTFCCTTIFKKDKLFYRPSEISNNLYSIELIKKKILNETINVSTKNWVDWPEKSLYSNRGKWEIYPFYAFGIWVNKNCNECPTIYKYLQSIRGLKLATLSRLSPKMKLNPHKGWGKHSNNVIRCHYGIVIPEGCYISVSDSETPQLFNSNTNLKLSKYPNDIIDININTKKKEWIQFHRQFEWLIFDDSKTHYAENMSDKERIVLIIDIERPFNIKKGISKVGSTEELEKIINYYIDCNLIESKNRNKTITKVLHRT